MLYGGMSQVNNDVCGNVAKPFFLLEIIFVILFQYFDFCYFVYFQDSDNLWWDAFATEFFEDEATLTLSFCLEDGPKRYSMCMFYF